MKRLPPDLITPFKIESVNEDYLLVLMAGKAKDPLGVKRRLEEYGVKTAAELLPLLPEPKRATLRTRVFNWLRRLEGSQVGDPNRFKPERGEYFKGYKVTKLR
jgi:hypothetical protein